MIKLRKSYNKLKIILCSVLGVVVALGGVFGIVILSDLLAPEKEVVVPDDTENYKKELAAGVTYSSLAASGEVSGIDNIGYMAWVLENSSLYHAYSSNETVSMGITQVTNTTKDYMVIEDQGVMVVSDITAGIMSSAMQSCYVLSVDGTELEGEGVYRRSGSGASSTSAATDVSWSGSTPTYYAYGTRYEDGGYCFTYGAYSTEMTVYLLNEETVESWGAVTENEDGTYTQTYYLNAEKAAYYYQYLMKTNGGLSKLPTFNSVTLTITFNDDYQVLEIVAKDVATITYWGISMDSSSTTTTTFSYDEEDIDGEHFNYYYNYYKQYVGTLTDATDSSSASTEATTVLMGVFSDMLTTTGQQFDLQLELGDSTYYGSLFLSVDINSINSDIASAIQAKLALSADKNLDSQDLYIEYSEGEISCYFSTNFALTVGVDEISSVVSDFTSFFNSFSLGTGATVTTLSATALSSETTSSFSLEDLLAGLTYKEDSNGNGVLTLGISDLYGISLSADINYTVSYGEDGTVAYSFVDATIGSFSYDGEEVELSLALSTPTYKMPAHDSSTAALDLSDLADNIFDLLTANSLSVSITVEGDDLAEFLTDSSVSLTDIDEALGYLGTSLSDLKLTVSGNVDIDGLTVAANVILTSADETTTYLDATVYYDYNGTGYGTAYLNITKIYGIEQTSIRVACDIDELSDSITAIIAAFNGGSNGSGGGSGNSSLSPATIINKVLSLDFGNVIKRLTSGSTTIGATLNIDDVLAAFGIKDVSFGNIVLSYTLGASGEYGKLEGEAAKLGLTATVTGSKTTVSIDKTDYLDVTEVVNAIMGAVSGSYTSAEVSVTISGINTNTFIDDYTYTLTVQANYDEDNSMLYAYASLVITESGKDSGTIFAMDVYYSYNYGTSADYGTAYVSITNLLGVTCSIKIKCDIKDIITSVSTLIEALAGESADENAENAQTALSLDISVDGITNLTSKVSAIVTAVSGIEWSSVPEKLLENLTDIVTEATINGEKVVVSVDAQVLLNALGLNDMLTLGALSASYSDGAIGITVTDGSKNTVVSATAKLGNTSVSMPDASGYLDVTTLITLITDAVTVAEAIEDACSVYFTVDADISVGDTEMVNAVGAGEIEWSEDGAITSVALSLTLKGNGDGTAIEFIFIYDCGDITISIDRQVLKIANRGSYASMLQTLSSGVTALMSGDDSASALSEILQSLGMSATTTTAYSGSSSGDTDTLSIIAVIVNQLNGDGILGALFSAILNGKVAYINEVCEELGTSVSSISMSAEYGATYTLGGKLTLGVVYDEYGEATGYKLDGALTFGNGKIVSANLSLTATAGGAYGNYDSYAAYLAEQLTGSNYTVVSGDSLEELIMNYAGLIWDYVFDAIDNVNIGTFLGSNTYSAAISIDGSKSGIKELEGVVVDATLYFSKVLESTSSTKLVAGTLVGVEIDELTVNDFTLSASIVYNGGTFYISVTEVNGTTLSGFNVSISSSSISSALESLVNVLNKKSVTSLFSTSTSYTGSGELAAQAIASLSESDESEDDQTTNTVVDILKGLLSLKLKEVVSVYNTTDGTVLSVDTDAILEALGIATGVGTAKVTVGTTSGKTIISVSIGSWATLTAEKSDYTSGIDGYSYYDINFIANLISDAAKFIDYNTDSDGNISTLYTFEAEQLTLNFSLSVSIIGAISVNITITDLSLTVGLDEDEKLFISAVGYLNSNSGLVSITANWIGFTYYNGYITLARGLDDPSTTDGSNSDAIYWVMTPEYFIDHLFAQNSGSSDSPIRWLTQMSFASGLLSWNTIANTLSSKVSGLSSGLTDPDELYLYSTRSGGSQSISIADYLAAYIVKIGENTVSSQGAMTDALSALGLKDSSDYYAFSLDGEGLTNGVVTALYLAITRNDTTGISGLNLYASISGMVTVSTNFVYSAGADTVANYYNVAMNAAENKEVSVDFNYSSWSGTPSTGYEFIFGSVKIEPSKTDVLTYDYSEALIEDYVTVYVTELDGNVWDTKLKYGSTIYLYDSSNLVKDDDGNLVIYVNSNTYVEGSTDIDETISVDRNTILTDNDGNRYINVKAVSRSDLTVVSVELYSVASDGSYSLIDGEAYNLFAGSSIPTDLISGYTLVGGTWYTDSALKYAYTGTAKENLVLYGRFVQSSVTINGVVYTFYDAGDASASNSTDTAHYEVSGYTNAISFYYEEDTILVLESEIDDYPVTAIRAGAFANDNNNEETSLKNVIVPSSITYVGGSAFLDNKGMQSILFLADSVYFGNDDYYPFYGTSRDSNSSQTRLQIYYTTYTSSGGYNDVFNFQSGNVIGDYGKGGAVYGNGQWVYVVYNITLNGETYNDAFGEFIGDGALSEGVLTSLPAYSTEDDIAEYVLGVINAYTYSTWKEHYIGLYNVEVSEDITLCGGILTINITITDSGEQWLPLTVTNVGVDAEGRGTGDYDVVGVDGAEVVYYTVGGATYTYLKVGASYTLTATSESSDFVGFETSISSSVNGNAITFKMPDGTAEIIVQWQLKEQKEVIVYSEIAFTYNGSTVSNSGNYYYIGESLIGDSSYLGTNIVATAEYTGYYFLGWAALNGDTLEFVTTATVNYLAEGVAYYAIWAYSSSNAVSGYTAASGSTLSEATTDTSGVHFYAWYKNNSDKSFSEVITAIDTSNTVVIVRWAYEFTITISCKGESTFYVDNILDGETTSTKYSGYVLIPEQSAVYVTYDTVSETYLRKTYTYTKICITVKDSSADNADTISESSVYAKKTPSGLSWYADRLLSVSEYTGTGWSHTSSNESITDSNKDTYANSVTSVTGALGISYST